MIGAPYVVPLASTTAQQVTVQLGDQPCQINVYQKSTGLYLDLYIADAPFVLGVLCVFGAALAMGPGFIGVLAFTDMQGESDPDYTGLADRFPLFWIG